ncbi:MAG TPA: response regulator transcription factor [Stellaceae bacterium]|nr:response regulator transcription factor [Stellaceae bacterium]
MGKIRLLLVDPQKLVREGIKKILIDTEFVVEQEAGDMRDLLAYLESGARPDIILAEIAGEGDASMAMLRSIREAAPDSRIVALNSNIAGLSPVEALKAGLSGLLVKDISPRGFVHALELVMMGEKIFPVHSDFLAAGDGEAEPAGAAESKVLDLSERERKVLQCLAGGLSNKLIARELDVTETTVKAHVKTILRKINAENRTQAAIWCLGNGLEYQPPEPVTVAPLRNGAERPARREVVVEMR